MNTARKLPPENTKSSRLIAALQRQGWRISSHTRDGHVILTKPRATRRLFVGPHGSLRFGLTLENSRSLTATPLYRLLLTRFHVIPGPTGKWEVRKIGDRIPIGRYDTKAKALRIVRGLARASIIGI